MNREKIIERVELIIYYLLKALILAGVPVALWQGEWVNAFLILLIFLFTYIPAAIKNRYHLSLPLDFDLAILVFVFLSLFLGSMHDYYYKIWWWDIFLHFGGALLLGIFGFMVVYILNEEKDIKLHMKPILVSLFSFTFAVTAGVIWEIYEFAVDGLLDMNMQKSGLPDTMWDLIVDCISAFIIATLGYLWLRKKISFFIFDRSISKFVKQNSDFGKEK